MGRDTVPSQYFLRDGTVPSRYFLRDGTVPSRYFLCDGTVPSRYFLGDGTVPSPNHYLKFFAVGGISQNMTQHDRGGGEGLGKDDR